MMKNRMRTICRLTAALAAACLTLALLPLGSSYADAGEPIEIGDRDGLAAIAARPEGNYRLTADIDMSGAPWKPIPFSGTLDGGGHTIYNLKIAAPDDVLGSSVDGNHHRYETAYAGLFSVVKDAQLFDLHLLGVEIDVRVDSSCFAACLAGCAENTRIERCSVSGRVYLATGGAICGVAGVVGYGSGAITHTQADVTLTLVDTNRLEKCEEFLGGILACGYSDVEGCSVTLDGYASVHGYVHNGGLIGMHHIPNRDRKHAGFVRENRVDAAITFFEDNDDRRAYCEAIIGENLNEQVRVSNNEAVRFVSNETTDYNTTLLPESCQDPVSRVTIIPPQTDAWGYALSVCTKCGYSYRFCYAPPVTKP